MEKHSSLPSGRLERMAGKSAAWLSVDDLVHVFTTQGIRVLSLMHIGGDGWLKTLDFVPRDDAHLRDVLEGGERADGSSLFPQSGIEPGASDIVLRPRIGTAFLDPFARVPTLAVLCGHVGRDGRPLPESPSTIVESAAAHVTAVTGCELHALGEVEYFLGRRVDDAASLGYDDRGYHATSPFVFGEALRREAMTLLSEMGVPLKYGHSEVGYIPAADGGDFIWEQHEIELSLAPLPRAADAIALTQWVLRNLARREGMRCSFDPIMRKGHAGSGLHVHMSIVRDHRHQDVPKDDPALPPEAQQLIGGLVTLGAALMAFGNRTEGSFVRLTQGKEAPNTVTWGRYNRHALIRLPIQAMAESGRVVSIPTIEFRLPDGSAHPYLLLAGLAQAFVRGRDIDDLPGLLASTRSSGDRSQAIAVPRDFLAVARALEEGMPALAAGAVFPERMLQALASRLQAAGSPGLSPL